MVDEPDAPQSPLAPPTPEEAVDHLRSLVQMWEVAGWLQQG